MRITKLEFENLNSLKGKWCIDFTHPDYAKNHDIFVICGPTGSGKTTLLDAITLALYGRTARLESINNGESGNEIMTRGTGFCRASVTYSCRKGVFFSEFQQNRAGMKSGGNLQKASFKITKIGGDENLLGDLFSQSCAVVASGTGSNLGVETQKIIQLDYKQFCRSIMLAQGDFSAFLESNARERAEILEKLTGTERYREIGKKIAAHFSDLKKAFKITESQKEEIEKLILSDADEKSARESEKSLEDEISVIEEKSALAQRESAFFEELDRLQSEVSDARAMKERLDSEKASFAAEKNRLLRAESAKNAEGDYLFLKNLRDAQKNDEKQLQLFADGIETAGKSCIDSAEKAGQAKNQLEFEMSDMAECQSLWKQVRALDVRIHSDSEKAAESRSRLDSAEKKEKENEQKISLIQSELAELEKKSAEITRYRTEHADDARLSEILAKIETLFPSFVQAEKRAGLFHANKEAFGKQLSVLEGQTARLRSELSAIDEKIRSFVSSDAVFIARILRRELSEGNPCPVCGSPYHASHETAGETAGESGEAKKERVIAEESANLSGKRDELEAGIHANEAKAESLRSDIKNAETNLAEATAGAEELRASITSLLSPWNVSLDGHNHENIISDLKKRAFWWEKSEEKSAACATEKSTKSAELDSRIENRVVQGENLEKFREEFKRVNESLQAMLSERRELFGEKSVDEEENKKNERIASLREIYEKAVEIQNRTKEEKARLEAQKTQLERTCADRSEKLLRAEENFSSKIIESGFDSETDFCAACLSDAELDALRKKSEYLILETAKAKTALEKAESSLASYKAESNIVRSREELRSDIENLSAEKEAVNARLIDVKTLLSTNRQNKERAENIRAVYEKALEEYGIWEQMNKWAGTRDGADLSVFVQSLAFSSLLSLANKKLFGITKRYKLVQKTAGSLDFEIQDIYFDEPRSVANLSGGEKFLVSLSFALGISEFASRNVRVDSLFLDEGFGTLSGELLTEAINALKNLQKDGKMLGIITHVQDVISEIDQRIEVKPVSLGHSELIGSGIRHG